MAWPMRSAARRSPRIVGLAAMVVAAAAAALRSSMGSLFLVVNRPAYEKEAPSLRLLRSGGSPTAGLADLSTVSAPACSRSGTVWFGALASLAAAGAALGARSRRDRKSRASSLVRGAAVEIEDCPFMEYGTKDVDIAKERSTMVEETCPLEVQMPPQLAGDEAGQLAYFRENIPQIYADMKKHGAVVFRGFELSKEAGGFKEVVDALELERCEDPLHSVAARPMYNKDKGVYEAVNKASRANFYIGMHNEMVGDRAPGSALWVCFKAADEGGEFLVADGRKMFRELDEKWLKELYERDVTYSVAEFPMQWTENLPGIVKDALEPVLYNGMKAALQFKVDFATDLKWETSSYNGSKVLQVRGMPQSAIVRHPYTNEPLWWGSMHSHSEYLRKQRETVYGEAQETEGSSRVNITDVHYGDTGTKVEVEWMKHVDEVTKKCSVPVKMKPGDMVLMDNYTVMHARAPFKGERKHCVTWCKAPNYSKAAK